MKCPRCSTSLTKLDADEGIVVHRCQGCSGTWHDKGILDEFSRRAFSEFLLEKLVLTQYPSDLRCPRCEVPMEKNNLGPVEFPVGCCRSCRGLWLDLGQIPQSSAAQRAKLDEMLAQVRAQASHDPPWVPWVTGFLIIAVAGLLYFFEKSLKELFLIRLIGVLAFWLAPAGLVFILWRAWKTGELHLPGSLVGTSRVVVKKIDEPIRFWLDFVACVSLLVVFLVLGIVGVMCPWLEC